jgi:hypothetical protein
MWYVCSVNHTTTRYKVLHGGAAHVTVCILLQQQLGVLNVVLLLVQCSQYCSDCVTCASGALVIALQSC